MSDTITGKLLSDVFGGSPPVPQSNHMTGRVLRASQMEQDIRRITDDFLAEGLKMIERPNSWIDFGIAVKLGLVCLAPDRSVTGWTEIQSGNRWRAFRPTDNTDDANRAVLRLIKGCAIQYSINSSKTLAQIKTLEGAKFTVRDSLTPSMALMRCLGSYLNNTPDTE